jgi:hypothetical protein
MAVRPHVLEPDPTGPAGPIGPVGPAGAGFHAHAPGTPRHTAPRPVLRLVAPPSGRPGMAFVVLAALAVGALLLGLVVLNVLVAQKSFRLNDLNTLVQREEARSQQLRFAVATAGSPERVAEAATRLGLVPPERQEFLVRPGGDAPAPGGDRQEGAR